MSILGQHRSLHPQKDQANAVAEAAKTTAAKPMYTRHPHPSPTAPASQSPTPSTAYNTTDHSTHASRLRTGTTLLMQPIQALSATVTAMRTTTRRGGVVNYTDPGLGDDPPNASALNSNDSDFVASGGTRTAIR
jgi:chromatin structure-remodeling complex subunit SFH1